MSSAAIAARAIDADITAVARGEDDRPRQSRLTRCARHCRQPLIRRSVGRLSTIRARGAQKRAEKEKEPAPSDEWARDESGLVHPGRALQPGPADITAGGAASGTRWIRATGNRGSRLRSSRLERCRA